MSENTRGYYNAATCKLSLSLFSYFLLIALLAALLPDEHDKAFDCKINTLLFSLLCTVYGPTLLPLPKARSRVCSLYTKLKCLKKKKRGKKKYLFQSQALVIR